MAPAIESDPVELIFLLTVISYQELRDSDIIRVTVTNRCDLPITAGYPVITDRGEEVGIQTDMDAVITELHTMNPEVIAETENKPDEMPYGLFDFKIRTVPGNTVEVYIQLPEPADAKAGWFKYDVLDGWSDYSDYAIFSPDRSLVTILLTDGGTGDADGIENGIIADPSGIGINATGTSGIPKASDNGGSGGCFIGALMGAE